MNIAEVENAIVDRLRTKVVPRVYVSEVPTQDEPPLPFIVIAFNFPIRTARDRHLTNVRNDTRIGIASLRVVSSDIDSANAIMDKVDDYLTGWEPPNSGQMIPEFNTRFSSAGTTTQPTRYYRTMGYTFRTNLNWVEEPNAW